MDYSKYYALIAALYQKTMKGEIKWSKTASDRIFLTSFSDYSILFDHYNIDDYAISLTDKSGEIIESVTDSELDEGNNRDRVYFKLLRDLYSKVRRQGSGAEDALNSILNELSD